MAPDGIGLRNGSHPNPAVCRARGRHPVPRAWQAAPKVAAGRDWALGRSAPDPAEPASRESKAQSLRRGVRAVGRLPLGASRAIEPGRRSGAIGLPGRVVKKPGFLQAPRARCWFQSAVPQPKNGFDAESETVGPAALQRDRAGRSPTLHTLAPSRSLLLLTPPCCKMEFGGTNGCWLARERPHVFLSSGRLVANPRGTAMVKDVRLGILRLRTPNARCVRRNAAWGQSSGCARWAEAG